MKAGIIFTGSGPILILTTYDSLDAKAFKDKLAQKGINKFLAFEVPLELGRQKYGQHFDVILKDVKQTDDLRVLDYNGFNILHNFPFSAYGQEIRHEG